MFGVLARSAILAEDGAVVTTLDDVAKKTRIGPSAEQQAAVALVRLAQQQSTDRGYKVRQIESANPGHIGVRARRAVQFVGAGVAWLARRLPMVSGEISSLGMNPSAGLAVIMSVKSCSG